MLPPFPAEEDSECLKKVSPALPPQPVGHATAGGFSVAELIISIVVVSLMAVLLSPAFKRSIQNARQNKCSSNLHQLYVATNLYIGEHNFELPLYKSNADGNGADGITSGFWHRRIAPYLSTEFGNPDVSVSKIFVCPSDPNPSNNKVISYGMNSNLAGFRTNRIQTNPFLLGEATGTGLNYNPNVTVKYNHDDGESAQLMFLNGTMQIYNKKTNLKGDLSLWKP